MGDDGDCGGLDSNAITPDDVLASTPTLLTLWGEVVSNIFEHTNKAV